MLLQFGSEGVLKILKKGSPTLNKLINDMAKQCLLIISRFGLYGAAMTKRFEMVLPVRKNIMLHRLWKIQNFKERQNCFIGSKVGAI